MTLRLSLPRLLKNVKAQPLPRYAVDKALLRQGSTAGIDILTAPGDIATDLSAAVSTNTLQQIVREAAEDGTIDVQLWHDITNQKREAAACTAVDYTIIAEACHKASFREFGALGSIGAKLQADVETLSLERVLTLAKSYSALGVLNEPLFLAIANKFMLEIAEKPEIFKDPQVVVDLARCFAAQRIRNNFFFSKLAGVVQENATVFSREQALSIFHSLAFLNLHHQGGESMEAFLFSGLESMTLPQIAEFAYALMLTDRLQEESLQRVLAALAPRVLESNLDNPAVLKKLLTLRAFTRYVRREMFESLPTEQVDALRKIHRAEMPTRAPHQVRFVDKLSEALRKLKVGHFTYATRGPFTFDVLERDVKLLWECNHIDRYYASTNEKLTTYRLQERIAKAMGYRVVQVPFWQWTKMTKKRTRIEYIRMSRYYALKDRREYAPREVDHCEEGVVPPEFQYLGEAFSRNTRPIRPWSWFQKKPPGILPTAA